MMKDNRAFTIVELLVIIVVVGILASIVVVSYRGAQRDAATSKKESTVASVKAATELHMARTEGNFQACSQNPCNQAQERDNFTRATGIGDLESEITFGIDPSEDVTFYLPVCPALTKDNICIEAYNGTFASVYWSERESVWVVDSPWERRTSKCLGVSAPFRTLQSGLDCFPHVIPN